MNRNIFILMLIAIFIIFTVIFILLSAKNDTNDININNNEYENIKFEQSVDDGTYIIKNSDNEVIAENLLEVDLQMYKDHPDYNPNPNY